MIDLVKHDNRLRWFEHFEHKGLRMIECWPEEIWRWQRWNVQTAGKHEENRKKWNFFDWRLKQCSKDVWKDNITWGKHRTLTYSGSNYGYFKTRFRCLPRYEASPHIPQYYQFRLQTTSATHWTPQKTAQDITFLPFTRDTSTSPSYALCSLQAKQIFNLHHLCFSPICQHTLHTGPTNLSLHEIGCITRIYQDLPGSIRRLHCHGWPSAGEKSLKLINTPSHSPNDGQASPCLNSHSTHIPILIACSILCLALPHHCPIHAPQSTDFRSLLLFLQVWVHAFP